MIGAGTPLLPGPQQCCALLSQGPLSTWGAMPEPSREATEDRAVFLKLGFILETQQTAASLETVSPMGTLLFK